MISRGESMKAKRKIKPKRFIFCVCMLLASGIMFYQGGKVIYTTFAIKENIKEGKKKSLELDQKKADLEGKKEDLSNPDYVEYVARGKFLVTKQGEQIFKFPKLEQDDK